MSQAVEYGTAQPRRGWRSALLAQRDLPEKVSDPAEASRLYRYWRIRILATSIFGYATYYFVRSNISVPLKAIGADLGYSKEKLGIILTLGGVTYGISKFANGFLGDRANPRYFMAIGLLGCALMNVLFGLSSTLLFLGAFWMMNNWTQGMGFPPCARNMGYWFSPRERGTSFGVWHSSHMIGAALISALTGYLLKYLGWRSCFYVPAGIAAVGAVIIAIFLRDTPGSLGLPPVEVFNGEETQEQLDAETESAESYGRVTIEYIFKNPYMWIISLANLLVYVLRYAQMNWGPTFLQESKGMSAVASGWLGFGSEMAGMCSALLGGLIADRLFRGRAGRVCVIAMLMMALAVYGFWKMPASSRFGASAMFLLMGFSLYIPQMLIAAMAMNLATKRCAAAAVGLTGIFGYASTVISGWWLGKMVDAHGWDRGFILMIICALGTAGLMALTWNVGQHPHASDALPAGEDAPHLGSRQDCQ